MDGTLVDSFYISLLTFLDCGVRYLQRQDMIKYA